MRWLFERIFDELEGRDFLVLMIVVAVSIFICLDKISEERIDALFVALISYAVGRQGSWGGGGGVSASRYPSECPLLTGKEEKEE